MRYERLWERLLEFLNGWSSAVETVPGRVEVTVEQPDGSRRMVEIRMTHGEWDNMVTIPWGDFDLAANEVRKSVLGVPDHERFLVYADYELVPSLTPTLPVDPDEIRLGELARQNPERFRWVAENSDGTVQDEFGGRLD
jgi:hypothetical protein